MVNGERSPPDGRNRRKRHQVAFSDTGTMQVLSGTLSLQGDGSVTGSGELTAAAGAEIDFSAGSYTTAAGTSITGAGVISFSDGTVVVGGSYDVTGATVVSSGEVEFNSTASSVKLTQTAGTIAGSAKLTVSGLLTWTGGTMSGSGTTNADGGLTMGASGTSDEMFLDERTLNNAGAATLDGIGLFISSGATFDNESGASLRLNGNASIFNEGGTPAGGTVVNGGTLTKTGATDESDIRVAFSDTGTVQVLSGTLSLQGGGSVTGSGELTAAAGAELDFNAGSFTTAAGTSITGAGVISFSGGTVVVGGSYDVTGTTSVSNGEADLIAPISDVGANVIISGGTLNLSGGGPALTTGTLTMSAGTLTGSDTLRVSGSTEWTGGTMSGSGTTNADGGLTMGASGLASDEMFLDERTLNAPVRRRWTASGCLFHRGATVRQQVRHWPGVEQERVDRQ